MSSRAPHATTPSATGISGDPAPDGGPPNNWISYFGGGAWEFDPSTSQYYLHLFDRKQPDLNWRNSEVREAMYTAMRFWLDRGIDGFRVDVIWLLLKDAQFRDNPLNPTWDPTQAPIERQMQLHTADQAGTMEIIGEMRRLMDAYDERVSCWSRPGTRGTGALTHLARHAHGLLR